MDLFSCACRLCYDTIASEEPVCLSEPFGEDESFAPFLLRLFEGGEDDEVEDESYAPFLLRLFEGGEDDEDEDESYGPFLLRLFEGGEDDEDEDESYAPFLLRLFEGGEDDEDEDESYAPFLLQLFEGGEDDEDENVLAPTLVNEIEEEEVDVEVSDGSHRSQTQSNRDENDDDQHMRQGTIEDFHPPARSVSKKNVCLCTIAACMTSFVLAYVQAAISGSVAIMKIDLKITDLHLNVVTGVVSIITLFGLVTARWIADQFGRRMTMWAAGAMYFLGPLVMGIAPNYAVFLVGQGFAAFGAGFASMIAPMYMTEISPLFSRGFYVSCPQVFISLGSEAANWAIYFFSKLRPKLAWRGMLLLGAAPSVLLVLGVFALPESPQWLVMRGRLRDAKRILAQTSKSEEEAASRFADLKKAAGIPEEFDDDVYTNANQNIGVWRDIIHPSWSMVHVLFCAVGLQVVQQACGMDTLALFSPKVFERLGINTAVGKLFANAVLDLAKVSVSLLAGYLADQFGRRPLLLSSMACVFLSLMFVGMSLALEDLGAVKAWAIVYVICFSIGLGPITDVYCTEIIPLRMRAQVYTIGLVCKQGVSVILSYTYLLMFKAITLSGAALLFGGFAIVGHMIFYILMPETRGKTSDEMGQLFGRLRRTAANDVEMQRTEAAVSSE